MKETVTTCVVILILLFPSDVLSDWKKLIIKNFMDVGYVDITSIKKYDESYYVWGLSDFTEPRYLCLGDTLPYLMDAKVSFCGTDPILSVTDYYKVNCKGSLIMQLGTQYF